MWSSAGSVPDLDADSDRTGAIKNRNIARHLAEDHDARLWDATAAVVDDEMIRSPEAERTGRKIALQCDFRKRRRQVAGFLLT